MKKSLLFFAVLFVSISSFCQSPGVALSTIAYTSPVADLNGKTFTPQNPFTVAGGAAILFGNSGYNGGADYWDLSSYQGIEMKLTCDAAYIGKSIDVRFAMVNNVAAPQDIIKSLTFTSVSVVVKLDFTADAAVTKKLWAIKIPWSYAGSSYPVTIDYINAVTSFTTDVKDVNASADPNELVKVYDVTGRLIHSNVKRAEIMNQLKNGLYIVGGKKVFINHK
ncbi:MAG: hypothetical protein RIS29_604 [Bacteroidota bacterium]|jgi:roadblock/LC7 domain-containing protein